jgi:hypothetical protein
MGLFKDIRTTSKMGKEMYMQMDVKSTMANANAQMAALNAQMARSQLAFTGIAATATVTAARTTGAMVNMQHVYELDLLLMIPGRPPMPATVQEMLDPMSAGRAAPGCQLAVKVDPNDPSAVWIDWVATSTGAV